MPYHPTLTKNYAAPPFDAIKGKGVTLVDSSGKSYLDFTTGIAVTALGHCHPKWVQALKDQLDQLVHCSNLYGIPGQKKLADKLVKIAGNGKVLFCNSGAEANEALIKLARLHGQKKSETTGKPCFDVLTADNSFHGRTFGCMAATAQEKIQKGFHPMLKGFRHAQLNDLKSFEAQIDEGLAAVMLESIQGEGGIFPAEEDFLVGLKALCAQHNVLLLIDEVQCGIGRTGDFFAYQKSGILPDAIGMAKGLGGGFPIGAIWIQEAHSDLFQAGSHGTTFGGNPLASTAGNAVIDIIEEEALLENVRALSKPWHQALESLKTQFPEAIKALRGRGFMVGIEVGAEQALKVVELSRNKGLLIVPAGHNTIRLLPPLIASAEDLEKSVQILEAVFKELEPNTKEYES